jgi:hypothetical protein
MELRFTVLPDRNGAGRHQLCLAMVDKLGVIADWGLAWSMRMLCFPPVCFPMVGFALEIALGGLDGSEKAVPSEIGASAPNHIQSTTIVVDLISQLQGCGPCSLGKITFRTGVNDVA